MCFFLVSLSVAALSQKVLHPLGHPVTVAILRAMIKDTLFEQIYS